MSTQELGGRVDHNVGAVFDWLHQVRGGERGIDRQGKVVRMGHGCHGGNIENLDARVAESLREEQSSLGSDRIGKCLWIAGIDEGGVDAKPGHGQVQHVVAAAVDVAARHHVVSGLEDRRHRQV